MDNITPIAPGLDVELEQEDKIEAVEEAASKRKPFALWSVGGKDYKLKLTASNICKLEQKYGRNLISLVADDVTGIPPIATMLTVIQGAMQLYHHNITINKVQDIYDRYVDEGGDQNKLLSDVIMPMMGVSGFFTETQQTMMEEAVKDADSAL